eukprot:3804706-Amphidinium_carterae.1
MSFGWYSRLSNNVLWSIDEEGANVDRVTDMDDRVIIIGSVVCIGEACEVYGKVNKETMQVRL